MTFPPSAHPNRSLVLWMLNPSKKDRGPLTPENPYTCPEVTLGSYFYGPTRVSLLDTSQNTILNTIEIHRQFDGTDSYAIPYRLQPGSYYHVAGRVKSGEGWPQILYLLDYNGDGQALEFALFQPIACMGLHTALIGYSPTQDLVIRYPTTLEYREGHRLKRETRDWVDYLFSKRPIRPGFWRYEVDYRGRCGDLEQFEIRYDPATESFHGKMTVMGTSTCAVPPPAAR